MNTRRIYLKELSGDETVSFSDYHECFLLENTRNAGVFLRNPVLRLSLRGVYFKDITRNVDPPNVVFSATSYHRLGVGQ